MGYIAKFLTALVAALGVLINDLPGGVTATEWRDIAIAGIGALGVFAIPNTVRTAPPARPPAG
jgi:hydroxylamine reductase (hybrid-cluster protein)